MGVAHHRAQRSNRRSGQRRVCTQRHRVAVGLCAGGSYRTAVDRCRAVCIRAQAAELLTGRIGRAVAAHRAAKGRHTAVVDAQAAVRAVRLDAAAQRDGHAAQCRVSAQRHRVAVGLCTGGCYLTAVDRRAARCIGAQAAELLAVRTRRSVAAHRAAKGRRPAGVDGQAAVRAVRLDAASQGDGRSGQGRICAQRHRVVVGLRTAGAHAGAVERYRSRRICGDAGKRCSVAHCAAYRCHTAAIQVQSESAIHVAIDRQVCSTAGQGCVSRQRNGRAAKVDSRIHGLNRARNIDSARRRGRHASGEGRAVSAVAA